MLAALMAGKVLVGHSERESMHFDGVLTADKGFPRQRVDLLHDLVRHRIASGGLALSVHHEEFTGAPVRLVINVWIAEVEGQVVAGIRVHLVARDLVETLRRLPVPLSHLWPEITGPDADGVGLDVIEAAVVALFPHLELGFFLKNANEDRLVGPQALLAEEHHGLLGQRAQMRRDVGLGAGGHKQRHARNRAHVKAEPHASLQVDQARAPCPWRTA
jgi:hypothetical protein